MKITIILFSLFIVLKANGQTKMDTVYVAKKIYSRDPPIIKDVYKIRIWHKGKIVSQREYEVDNTNTYLLTPIDEGDIRIDTTKIK